MAQVPLWVLALTLAALGVGIGSTGSLGLLVQTVDLNRIVTAIVVWSQVGIAGYLVGPLTGGLVAEELGYSALGVRPGSLRDRRSRRASCLTNLGQRLGYAGLGVQHAPYTRDVEAAQIAHGSSDYLRLARKARYLSWASLGYMAVEGTWRSRPGSWPGRSP